MKKIIGSLIVVLALFCIAPISYAADPGGKNPTPSMEAQLPPPATPTCAVTLVGKVMSIDKEKNAVVVKDQYDKLDKTIYLSPEKIKTVKVGQTISFELSAPARSENVHVLKRPMKSKGPSSYGEGEPSVPGAKQ
jgi:hypothetical protein